ncbi:glycosyltransferase family 2 protein [Yoonia tamlensis]|nr:glycosyltransferase [Yoonia tamlensis]
MGAVDAARYLTPSSHLIYCAFDEADPAVIFLRKQLQAGGFDDRSNVQILTGRNAHTRNPKLDNIAQAYAVAPTDQIIFMDGNLRFGPHYVDAICADWESQIDVLSTSPVTTDEHGVWAYFEAAVLNLSHARWLHALARSGFPFAHGKLLAFRKSWLEGQGGFAKLHAKRAEDTALVALARNAGARIALTSQHQEIPLGKRLAGDVFARNLRWRFLRSRDLCFGYAMEPLSAIWFVLVIVGVLAAQLDLPIGLTIIAVWIVLHLSECWAWARVVRRWSPMMHLGLVLRDILEPFLWVLGWWLWRHRGWRDLSSAKSAKPSSDAR